MSTIEDSLTVLFEDNGAHITHFRVGYVKRDKTKHILLKFFYTHELQYKFFLIKQIRSIDNLTNLFIKSTHLDFQETYL